MTTLFGTSKGYQTSFKIYKDLDLTLLNQHYSADSSRMVAINQEALQEWKAKIDKPLSELGDILNKKQEKINAQNFRLAEIAIQTPHYAAGELALLKWIQQNLGYLAIAREKGISGTCYIRVSVNPSGLADYTIEKGIPDCEECNEAALSVLKQLPGKWLPGEKDGVKINSFKIIKLKFGFQ